MAENDEYQFVDPDAFEPSENVDSTNTGETKTSGLVNTPNIKLNALIAVLVLIFSVSIYHYITHRHKSAPVNVIQPVRTIIPTKLIEPQNPQPQAVAMPEVVTDTQRQMDQTLSSVQDTQHNMQSDLSGMNEHVTRLDERLGTIMTSIESLAQRVDQLSTTLDTEVQRIEHALAARTRTVHKKSSHHQQRLKPEIVKYYVEAVIPGRAWLIGSNSTTITVSVGTPIPGYGRVRTIDAAQGRVLTSSGKIMRFSQDDS